MKQIEVVAAIIRKDDKIFATQRGYGEWKDYWEFPGGKMEAGETPEEPGSRLKAGYEMEDVRITKGIKTFKQYEQRE